MNVCAFCMNNLPEVSLPYHVQRHQLEEIVAAVLEDHAMLFCFFGCFHQLPALFDSDSSGNLRCRVLSVFHSINGHWSMKLPRCSDVDQIDILPVAHFFPFFLTA